MNLARNPQVRPIITTVVRCCQLFLAAVFLFSGFSKCIDPTGTAIKIGEYLAYMQLSVLDGWTMLFSWCLCIAETLIGLHLLLGRSRHAVYYATLMMLFFTPLTLFLALYDPIEDCGCFGDVIRLTNWETFYKNVVLCLALLPLLRFRYRCWRPLSEFWSAFYSWGAFILMLVVCLQGTWGLPYIDFRPYHPGTAIAPSVTSADEAAQSQYWIVYERDGQRQTFPLDSIPDESEGWAFVETIEVPVADTGTPQSLPAANESFFLTDEDYEDVTHEICDHPGYTFLLMSPSLADASERFIDRIEEIYEYCREQEYPFYLVTLRDTVQLAQWYLRTGAEYPTRFSDASVISTVIRANPGVVLLKDGVIQWKSCLGDIDISALTSAKLSEQTYGETAQIDYQKRLFWLLFWLFGPFSVLLLLQKCYYIYKFKKK